MENNSDFRNPAQQGTLNLALPYQRGHNYLSVPNDFQSPPVNGQRLSSVFGYQQLSSLTPLSDNLSSVFTPPSQILPQAVQSPLNSLIIQSPLTSNIQKVTNGARLSLTNSTYSQGCCPSLSRHAPVPNLGLGHLGPVGTMMPGAHSHMPVLNSLGINITAANLQPHVSVAQASNRPNEVAPSHQLSHGNTQNLSPYTSAIPPASQRSNRPLYSNCFGPLKPDEAFAILKDQSLPYNKIENFAWSEAGNVYLYR